MYECYKLIRDRLGLTDSEVSRITGIRRATFSEWSASGIIMLKHLVKIADALSCSLDELVGRTVEREE